MTAVPEKTYTPVYPLRLRPYGLAVLNARCTLCGELSGGGSTGWAWDALTGHFPAGGDGVLVPPGDFCPFCVAALLAAGRAAHVDADGRLIPRD